MAAVSKTVLAEKKIIQYGNFVALAKEVGGHNGAKISGTACD
jgi:hypothetical protein